MSLKGTNNADLENVLGASGGSGGSAEGYSCIFNVTYNQLVAAIAGSTLQVGCYYRITDYRTVHIIGETTDVYTGNINPIIIRAIAVNALSQIGDCGLYKGDIIYYNINNSGMVPGSTTGFIYRRIDNKYNINMPIDFKGVKYRRWAINNTNVWNSGTAYIKGDFVNDNGGKVYMAIRDNINQITPVNPSGPSSIADNTYWTWLGYNNGDFVAESSTLIANKAVGINPASFVDYPIFDAAGYALGTYANIDCSDVPNQKTDASFGALNIYNAFNNVFIQFCYFHNIFMSGYYVFTGNTFKGISDSYGGASKMYHSIITTHSTISNNYFYLLDFYDNLIQSQSVIRSNTVVKSSFGHLILTNESGITDNTTSYYGNLLSCNFNNNSRISNTHITSSVEACTFNTSTQIYNILGLEMYLCAFNGTVINNTSFTGVKNLLRNTFNNVSINGISTISSALSSSYDVTVFSRVDGTPRLRFVDNNDLQVISQIT